MKASPKLAVVLAPIFMSLPACDMHKGEEAPEEHHKIVATSPFAKDVTVTRQYVCQIRSWQHIDVSAMVEGYLMEIPVQEGQAVKKGDVLFRILPNLYQAKFEAEKAEYLLAQLERENTKKLADDPAKVVSPREVLLYDAKMAKAQAKMDQAQTELNFTTVTARYSGIIDRLLKQQGSLISKGDILTTLSDNSVMWVYFNVPEVRYLEYKAGKDKESQRIELVLADGSKFPEPGKIGAIDAKFNNETGTIPFRADFPNPTRLLRHGQTGNVLLHRTLIDAIVIPQRATFEILDKRYVFVIDKDDVVRQRRVVIRSEMDDIFVIQSGVDANDKIVLEGGRTVRDGDKVEYEFRKPEEALSNMKNPAE